MYTAKHIHISLNDAIIFAKYFFEHCISECIDITTIRESLLCRKILSSAYLNIFDDCSIHFKTILITITSQENSIWWPKKNQTSFRALRHGELNIGESKLDYPCAFLDIYEYMHNLPWWMVFFKGIHLWDFVRLFVIYTLTISNISQLNADGFFKCQDH